jgi:pilus assembly protein CpaB
MRAALIGILVAGLSAFLLWSYLKRFEDEASGGPKVVVLTVVKTLEPGTMLKDADIGERAIPQAYVEPRMVRSSDRQRIANVRISVPLDAQQILNWTDIVAGSDDRIMSSMVQNGMRAVTIHTEGRSNALVHPGDRVDVIATLPKPGSSDHRTGVVLLQNVLVLGRSSGGVGAVTGGSNEGADIALSLSLQHSQLLAVAGDKAKLSVALRAPEDVRVQEGLGEISSAAIAEAEKAAAAAKPKTGPVPVGGGAR